MDGFPGLDGSWAVRMGVIQSEQHVSRPYLADKLCKGINVKGVDGIWIRLLAAISRLREISPMKHGPVPCLDKPICARSLRPGTFFGGRPFSAGRIGENLKASQAKHCVLVTSGYFKCDRVNSTG